MRRALMSAEVAVSAPIDGCISMARSTGDEEIPKVPSRIYLRSRKPSKSGCSKILSSIYMGKVKSSGQPN